MLYVETEKYDSKQAWTFNPGDVISEWTSGICDYDVKKRVWDKKSAWYPKIFNTLCCTP